MQISLNDTPRDPIFDMFYSQAELSALLFYINKYDRKLDHIGGGGNRSCNHVIPFSEVLRFVRYDLFQNDIFVFGTSVDQGCSHWGHLLCPTGQLLLHATILPCPTTCLGPWY